MKKDLVQIVMILDKSGSMELLKTVVVDGFNDFIKQQKENLIDKEVLMSLIFFDTTYQKVIYRDNINNIKQLTHNRYKPSGGTALLDTIGRTIDQLGIVLSNTNEDERPQKVIIAIMTDGEQNMSKIYTADQIKQMIQHQTQYYNWQFIFLSSDLNSIQNAVKYYGISSSNTMCYSADVSGYSGSLSSYSNMSRGIRARIDGDDSAIDTLQDSILKNVITNTTVSKAQTT